MKISKELAEILGFLCAEGCYVNSISSYWEFDKRMGRKRFRKNKKQRRIEFGNKNKTLLKQFQLLLQLQYNYSPTIGKDRICICKKKIIDDILTHTNIGHLRWSVPEAVAKGNRDIKTKFIRGYFEGDGTIINRIRFFSTNIHGLLQVSQLLKELNLRNKVNGPVLKEGRKPSYEIYVYESEKETFLKEINPLTKRPAPMRGFMRTSVFTL